MDNFDQLSSLLSPILNDPDAMSSIMEAAAQMGLGSVLGDISSSADENPQSAPTHHPSQSTDSSSNIGDILGSVTGSSFDMLGMIAKLAPLIQSISREDDTTRLLSALHPFLKGERERKLKNAQHMLSLMRVMSALKDSGLKL